MKILKTTLITILLTILLATAGIVFLLAYQKTFHLTYPPKTFVSGLDISTLKTSEAKELLENQIKIFSENKIKFSFNDKVIEEKISNLEIDFLIEETLSTISLQDLSHDFFKQLITKSIETNTSILININEEALNAFLLESFDISDISAKNANFKIGEKKNLEIIEETAGFKINIEELKISLLEDLKLLKNNSYEIELEEDLPNIKKEDLEELLPEMKSKLENKITLIDPVFSDNWTIRLIDYPDFIIFNEEENIIKIDINKEALDLFIDDKISKWLDRPAEDVIIEKDENEKIQIIGKGTDGTIIKRELFAEMIKNASNAKQNSVLIPIEPLTPKITVAEELTALGIKERLGVGHTSYYGSPANRVHNIKVGAERFNGTLIAPDEIFSFNTTLGPVNASTGYRKELVIKKEGTIPEFGGGLCQLSTTVYRAILFSGLPITDRRPHTYAVSYYSQIMGHGLDATIYLGGQDLKFKNNTGHHILLQAYVDGNYELYVTFYGTSDGRSVEMEGPYLSNYTSPGATEYITTNTLPAGQTKQVEKRHTGFTALWYRHLTDANGNTEKETIRSVYRAVPAKILVGAE